MHVLLTKRVWLALFFVLVFFILALRNQDGKDKFNIDNRENLDPIEIVNKERISFIAQEDTDNDNLADWEEDLWGTDKTNPDTDGDGTTDGEEVRLNRDPNKPGPDDFFLNNKSIQVSIFEEGESLSKTQRFGRELFAGYVELKTSGDYQGREADFLYNLLSQNITDVGPEKVYTLSDIKTTDNSVESIKNYGSQIISNLREGEDLQELSVIASLLETKSRKDEDSLQNIIDVHKRILNKNLETAVPREAERLHLAFIRSYNDIIESMVDISKISEDSLVSLVGIGRYSNSTSNLEKIVDDIREYLALKNIAFNRNEPGYILNK